MTMDISAVNGLVGQESARISTRHPANIPDIRHWCEVIREDNRSYQLFERDTVKAPPALLMVWAMPALWSAEPKGATEPHERVIRMLEDAGYGVGLTIALEQKFLRPLKIGERLSYQVRVAGVSQGEVATAVGPGYELELHYTFRNQDGEVVSEQTCRRAQVARLEVKKRH